MRRQAWSYRCRLLMLTVFSATSLAGSPGTFADPRPFIPPLACCDRYGVNASGEAACIGLPYIPTCDPAELVQPPADTWQLTLYEAINTAINNSQAVRNLGLVEAGSRTDIIRSAITTYDPLIARSEAQAQWGIFDPLLTSGIQWNKQDIPPGTSFAGIGSRPPQLDTADFETTISQLLPIGTRIEAELVTDYLFNPAHPMGLDPNPQYFSYTQFAVTQPFLRGFGVDVTMAPIKIAAAKADQTNWTFKQEMLALVRSIETTYWDLYAQQQNLRAIEASIPAFREIVRMREQQAGSVGTEAELAQAQAQTLLFEQRRLDALNRIAELQLVLRNLMGLPPNDCRNIQLLASPVTTKPFETMQEAVNIAISNRPDVLRQRLAVYVAQQERLLANNAFRPRLDGYGYWRTNGLGEDLNESYDVLTANNYNDWQLGVFFELPLGRRTARGELRAAEFQIARERTMLDQTAHQASYEVADAYRRINWVYQQLELVRARQEALARWQAGVRAQFENPPPGMTSVIAMQLYLNNLQAIVDTSLVYNTLLAEYNSALARLAEVKGTLLEQRLVTIAGDDPNNLPSDLPRPEIQLPESVSPAPSTPLPTPQNGEPQTTQAPAVSPQPMQPPSIEVRPEAPQIAELPAYSPEAISRHLPQPDSIAALPYGTLGPQVSSPAPPFTLVPPTAQSSPHPMLAPSIELPSSLTPTPAPEPTAARPVPSTRYVQIPMIVLPEDDPTPVAIPSTPEPRTASRSMPEATLRLPSSLHSAPNRSIIKPSTPASTPPRSSPTLELPPSLMPSPAAPQPTPADGIPAPLNMSQSPGGEYGEAGPATAGTGPLLLLPQSVGVSAAVSKPSSISQPARAIPRPSALNAEPITPTPAGPQLMLPSSVAATDGVVPTAGRAASHAASSAVLQMPASIGGGR